MARFQSDDIHTLVCATSIGYKMASGKPLQEKFTLDDIHCLMSAVSLAYNMATRKQAKEYWNDLAQRLNDLAEEGDKK